MINVKLTQQEADTLLDLLRAARVDSILDDNTYDQDELGLLMAKLGESDMIEIYLEGNEWKWLIVQY